MGLYLKYPVTGYFKIDMYKAHLMILRLKWHFYN